MENKKKLTVLIANDVDAPAYITYLKLLYDVTVVKDQEVKNKSDIDLVLFTGGEDVNPEHYLQDIGKHTSINAERDELEINIFHKYRYTPKLGICRGAQFLTVMSGGSLVQHVEGHTQEHMITVAGYGNYVATSTHHQMMFPYKLNDLRYQLLAWSTKFRSKTYLNGNNDEIELPTNFLEPEIIKYTDSVSLCIQGHPEFGNSDFKSITLELISQFLKENERKSTFSNPSVSMRSDQPYRPSFVDIDNTLKSLAKSIRPTSRR